MSDLAIRVDHLSKLYHLGRAQQRHDTLRDVLSSVFSRQSAVFSRRSHPGTDNCELKTDNSLLWALRDVSFEVQRGEVVGIIGRNGAGKSTLLKILSRITEPTSGRAEIHGRVASLLEVGTGFHPELTGRENIYLNGAILGMHRAEIQRRFDEIVAFAEIERFLDTPVKRYSSGMYVRLAFAVAAHLEPEILLVDEVLAVGDAQFQKKCLGKMGDVAKEGRTILFVSHNMGAITELCSRAMLLATGVLILDDNPDRVIAGYLSITEGNRSSLSWSPDNAPGEEFKLLAIGISESEGNPQQAFRGDSEVTVNLRYALAEAHSEIRVGIRILGPYNTIIFATTDHDSGTPNIYKVPGVYTSSCRIPGNLLNSGHYGVSVTADIPMRKVLLETEPLVFFDIELAGAVGARYSDHRPGLFRPLLDWATQKTPS